MDTDMPISATTIDSALRSGNAGDEKNAGHRPVEVHILLTGHGAMQARFSRLLFFSN
jgi:hypothetical protein